MQTFIQDVVYALRMLRRTPGSALAAIVCIALGIGANAAIFGVIGGVLLQPLPFDDPDRLVVLSDTLAGDDGEVEVSQVSPENFLAWRGRTTPFQELAAVEIGFLNLTGTGEPVRVRSAMSTAGLFPLLGVAPLLGRTFGPEEDRPGLRGPVVVLSHGFWRSHFGGDPQILGKTLSLDGRSYSVIGVMPSSFRYPEGVDVPGGPALWMPLGLDPADRSPAYRWHTLYVPARLQPGVSLAQARERMGTIAAQLARDSPDTHAGWSVAVDRLHDGLVGDIRPVLTTLMAVVGFVLLIACVNVANLQIARTLTRRNELALRMSLGCGRGRLIRQLLTESLVLAALAGLLGVAFARLAIPLLLALNPSQLSLFENVRIDGAVLAFAAGLSLLAGVLIGLAPALRTGGIDLHRSLQEGSGRTVGRGPGQRLQNGLVVAEVALGLILLVGAGVLLKSLLNVQQVDPGFDARNVLTLGMVLPDGKYPEQHQRNAFVAGALEQVRAVPGVVSAGTSLSIPLGQPLKSRFVIEGRPVEEGDPLLVNLRIVSPGYLETMGISLLRGRGFTAADDAAAPPAVIVSQELARRYWPGQDALGKRIKRFSSTQERPWMTIVGIAEDVKDAGLDAPVEPTWYLPYTQHDYTALRLAVRAAADPLQIAQPVQAAIHGIDRDQALFDIAPMEELLAASLLRRRFSAFLVSLFAALGLILVTVGIYGVISHLVGQRRREIGIRMVLGAQPGQVLALAVRDGLVLTLLGLAIGLVSTVFLTRFLASFVFGLTPTDPSTLLQTSVILAAAALLATLLPALRARRVDPLTVLKE